MDNHQLAEFIVAAKKATYASQDDDFSLPPLMPESKYLVFDQPPFSYSDTYFGMNRFAGQEIVYYQSLPVWSMCYMGGGISTENISHIYVFLRKALRAVPLCSPFRGGDSLYEDGLHYVNHFSGNIQLFRGEECIYQNKSLVYRLNYLGGLLS